ncbi:extracellular solute-binding protein family 5 [Caldicellulosiruptor hydrothermalis 108]|uniref:Extracellular solute-binding protein family 5 n=1 Tax=Caldicellulosiruptor hydrothermalis (strain DSM 18901 / VKM B-2411 / 108) TaxID=632292 RepID=E4Q8C6_CALH1|nr:ABC transporter substrate-binding protein [Caldicellulosiruptor hydrothermalis]ADQ07973.1 extracellular solute-binding protein family 5 [Caldicellulosiruptor hydrothermalis 108]
MSTRVKRLIAVLVLGIFFIGLMGISLGASSTSSAGELRLATDWPYPFHGNPFGAGAVGGAWWFVYEPFAYYIPQSDEYIPRLAESWKIEKGKVTVTLRKNAKFSDGKPFTAKDVVNSVNFIQAMWQWPYEIQSVTAPNDYTVVFTLSKDAPQSFVHTILTDAAIPALAPYHVYSKWANQAKEVAELGKKIFALTSSGKTPDAQQKSSYDKKADDLRKQVNAYSPFKTLKRMPVVGSFEPTKITQSEMVLTANKYHWLYPKMKINRITFRRWSSNEFVWASLISGEIYAAHPNMPKDVVEQLTILNPSLKVKTTTDLSEIALVFNYQKPLFKDVNLRKVIAYVLDKSKVRDVAVWQASTCSPYAHGILKSMESKWISKDTLNKLTKYNTNTKMAEEILKKAGYKKVGSTWQQPNGQPVAFTLSVYGPHSDWVLAAREVVQQLNNFGFKVEMKLIPDGMRDQVMKSGDYEAAIEFGVTWQGYPHPYSGYLRLYEADLYNITKFPSKDKYSTPWGKFSPYDLTEQLRDVAQDKKKSMDVVQKLAYITNEYLPIIPLFEKVLPIYYSDKKVTGWPAKDDPIWSLAPGGIERVYNLLITTGKLAAKK